PQRHVLGFPKLRPPESPTVSCAAQGFECLFEDLMSVVQDRGLRGRLIVNLTNCLKHCSRGITVSVYPDNVWYGGVRPEDLEEIFQTHLREGRAVERLLMPDIPWE